MENEFNIQLAQLQPSQLYINADKLAYVLQLPDPAPLGPIPVKRLGDRIILTDGHSRAFAAYVRGCGEVRVVWDEDPLDWEAYARCVDWCQQGDIRSVADLKNRVVGNEQFETLWLDRCRAMQHELERERQRRQSR
jgi:hypothetical protein